MKLAILALALAGCSIGDSGVSDPSPPPSIPPASGCAVDLQFDPPFPVANPSAVIRVTSSSGVPNGAVYQWGLSHDGASVSFAFAEADQAAISFVASTPGVYTIAFSVGDGVQPCASGTRTLNVRAPGAKVDHLRLRVVPPAATGAPPLEQPITVDGGASADLGVVVVQRGLPIDIQVRGPGGGVPAYVRFSPNGAREAVVESFASATGELATTLLGDYHAVLVVPESGHGAPRRITDWWALAPSDLIVDAGTTVTGRVRDPGNAAIAGATVQLSIDGVPSTVATSDAAGDFALQVAPGSGPVTVTVTPPAASGLPRLSATAAFDLGASMEIRYAANLVRRSLAGVDIERAGTPVAGAQLMVVGSLAAVGAVTAGATVTASGEVRIAVTANGAGTLPAALVPAGRLAAVITAAPGDLAVAELDTTTAVPASLDAPAPQVIVTGAHTLGGSPLPGGVLDVVPTGALALAMAPALHVIADGNGTFSAALAAGGHYDLRFLDPSGRAAPRVVADQVATTIERDGYALPQAITILGALLLGGTQPLANASIQILCTTCTGVDRAKPIAEVMSDEAGRFTLAVPDPGTM